MLTVKFYSTMSPDNENVLKGISGNIPAIVIDTEKFPNEIIDETFSQMSEKDYENYLESIKPNLDNWKTTQEENNPIN